MLLSGRTSQAAPRCRSSRVACRSPPQSPHGLTYQHTLLSQSSCCHYQRVLLTLPTRCYRHIAINTLLSTHTALSVFLLSLSTSSTNATDTLLPTHCYQHIAINTLLPTHCYQHIAINTLLSTHTALSVFLLSLSTSFTNATNALLSTHTR